MNRISPLNRIARAFAFVLALSWHPAGPQSAQAGDAVVFRSVRVFDGSKVMPPTTVVVRDGLIVGVGPLAGAPDGATLISGEGKTLLPGLIDGHTHTFSAEHLRQAVVFGVTTELDMFTDAGFAARMKSEQAAGNANDRADLRSCGTLATAPGGHGTEYGLKIPTIAKPDEADAFVAARITEGSDYIKIIYDDGHELGIVFPTLSRPTLAAVIKAAHAQKKLAVVHVHALENARAALAEGADGLVHLFFDEPIDDDFIALAVKTKAFVMPTLTVLESVGGKASGASLIADKALSPYLSPSDARALESTFPKRPGADKVLGIPPAAVRKLRAAGVPILAGTDAPNAGTAHGVSIHRELELLVAAGLSPTEALAAATSLPAARFGLTDRGRVATGLRADLVLVEGDPTADIMATRKIVGVWKQGRPVDRDSYRRNVQKQTEQLVKGNATAPPLGSEKGLVSDFEGNTVRAAFGSGWVVSTDSLVGGKSKAEIKLVAGGAGKSKGSLRVRGTIDDRAPPRWAGAMFSPGPTPMAPANLAAKKAIVFRARGDGKTCSIMVFAQSNGFVPSIKTFVAGSEWEEHRFALKDFEGCDAHGLMGVFFGGGAEAGPFDFQIDDVRFE